MKVTIEIDDELYRLIEMRAGLFGRPVDDYVADLVKLQAAPLEPRTVERQLGWAAGMGIKVSDDFDEPLDEFKDYT